VYLINLVWSRPSLPKEVMDFEDWIMTRLNIKLRLTYYWKVMGRSSAGFEEWMKLNIKYIEERSFGLRPLGYYLEIRM